MIYITEIVYIVSKLPTKSNLRLFF